MESPSGQGVCPVSSLTPAWCLQRCLWQVLNKYLIKFTTSLKDFIPSENYSPKTKACPILSSLEASPNLHISRYFRYLQVPPAPRDPLSFSGCPLEIKCSKIPQKKTKQKQTKKPSFFQAGPPLRGHKDECKFASVWLASFPQRPAETRFLLPMNESTMRPHITVSRYCCSPPFPKPATPIQTPPSLSPFGRQVPKPPLREAANPSERPSHHLGRSCFPKILRKQTKSTPPVLSGGCPSLTRFPPPLFK